MKHTVTTYFEHFDSFHEAFNQSSFYIYQRAYGFPVFLDRGVYVADPDMSHSSGIVINNFPSTMQGMDVLDVGCGAGIIALTAAYRGARVVACDYDERAVRLSQFNVADMNPDVAHRIHVMQSDVFASVTDIYPFRQYDIIAANLWFPSSHEGRVWNRQNSLGAYHRYFNHVRSLLKPDGVACLTSGAIADTQSTHEIMKLHNIEPYTITETKCHFEGAVSIEWHLHCFDKKGKPADIKKAGLASLEAHKPSP